MDLDHAINGRSSVREYTRDPVDDASIRRLIGAAIRAPSAVNEQPWTFTVLRDASVLDRISRAAKAHMLATLPEGSRSDPFRERLSDPSFHIFYHAPALILISASKPGPWIVEDCALAAQNLMLAAYGAGLGTCWIGFAQGYLNTPEGKSVLALPPESISVAPIIVGHPKAVAPATGRKEPQIRWVN